MARGTSHFYSFFFVNGFGRGIDISEGRTHGVPYCGHGYVPLSFWWNIVITGWERTGQMLCIVDTSLSVLMTLRMCLHELCCLFTVWI